MNRVALRQVENAADIPGLPDNQLDPGIDILGDVTDESPESNGMSEAFVNTLKRDYVRVTPLPNAEAVLDLVGGRIKDYNQNHPHSGLKMRSPREFIAAQNATA